jgi:hypothetical protein
MRKTTEEIEVNFAYRWFLGCGMHEQIPHFSKPLIYEGNRTHNLKMDPAI